MLARTLLALAALGLGLPRALPDDRRPPLADPVLQGIVAEALARSPEHARAQATAAAERHRVPLAGAFPDPTVSLGIQNDGFGAIQIGTMETSFWQVMVTQPIPWPGKPGARARAADAQADTVAAQLERVRLSITGEVERAWIDLLLVRGQLALQSRLESLWREAEAVARARYEVGQAPQSDLLRAQLERTRLQQQRIALEAGERTRLQILNRLRVHPLDEPIVTASPLPGAPDPAVPGADEMVADAERRSPDLAQARLATAAAERRVESARRERLPDFSVTAGVMPRGSLEPMWLASVGITVPIFSAKGSGVTESASRREAEGQGEESTRQLVRLRAAERHALLSALVRTNQIYRGGLLVQSEAAVRSALAQYQVGKVTFPSVLEVLRGLVADEGGYLASVAQAQRVEIAQREVSLEPAAALAAGLATGTVPGAGAAPTADAMAKAASPASPATAGEAAAGPAGGGMPSGM